MNLTAEQEQEIMEWVNACAIEYGFKERIEPDEQMVYINIYGYEFTFWVEFECTPGMDNILMLIVHIHSVDDELGFNIGSALMQIQRSFTLDVQFNKANLNHRKENSLFPLFHAIETMVIGAMSNYKQPLERRGEIKESMDTLLGEFAEAATELGFTEQKKIVHAIGSKYRTLSIQLNINNFIWTFYFVKKDEKGGYNTYIQARLYAADQSINLPYQHITNGFNHLLFAYQRKMQYKMIIMKLAGDGFGMITNMETFHQIQKESNEKSNV